MLKTIATVVTVVLVAAVAIILGLAMTKPDSFRVQRSIDIKAPAEKIFALIDDFRSWTTWSPYEHRDPDMQRALSGAESGKGAVYEWQGNSQVGQGRMEIIDTVPPHKVTIRLDFVKPIEGHNVAEFTLEPSGDSTKVTWAMDGPSPFIAKVMGVFFSMDKMIGTDFEAGLANLKRIAEQ